MEIISVGGRVWVKSKIFPMRGLGTTDLCINFFQQNLFHTGIQDHINFTLCNYTAKR